MLYNDVHLLYVTNWYIMTSIRNIYISICNYQYINTLLTLNYSNICINNLLIVYMVYDMLTNYTIYISYYIVYYDNR